MLQQKVDSVTSYCASVLCIAIGWIVEAQDILGALTILLGFFIAVIRFSHDVGLTKLLLKLFKKKE